MGNLEMIWQLEKFDDGDILLRFFPPKCQSKVSIGTPRLQSLVLQKEIDILLSKQTLISFSMKTQLYHYYYKKLLLFIEKFKAIDKFKALHHQNLSVWIRTHVRMYPIRNGIITDYLNLTALPIWIMQFWRAVCLGKKQMNGNTKLASVILY